MNKNSRFATVEEIETLEFNRVSLDLETIHHEYNLPDHRDINLVRYPWSEGIQAQPEIYASRLWEYPFAILSAELEQGMLCADIGCGMSAFTIYLRDVSNCNVLGIDPDLFEKGIKHLGHGVSEEFLERTNLSVVESTDKLNSEYFNRVFCISVIEHLPRIRIPGLMKEMVRILKPGGLLIMTVDVNINYDMARPMDLLWQSGLVPLGELSLRWPRLRFGLSDNLEHSADVYGIVLYKPEWVINYEYGTCNRRISQAEILNIRMETQSSLPLPLKVRRFIKANFIGR